MTAMVAMVFFGCKESPYINQPGDNSFNTDTIPEIADPDPTPDPEGVDIPENAINVNEAVKIARKLAAGETSKEKYFTSTSRCIGHRSMWSSAYAAF